VVLTVVALAAVPVAAHPAGRAYELRTYHAAPGRLEELHDRFRKHSLPLIQRHGAEVVGTWVPRPNPDNAVVALLAYPSAAARDGIWTRIVADPQWTVMKRQGDRRGLLVGSIEELPLTAVKPLLASRAGELELRTQDTPEVPAGALAAFAPTVPRPGTALLTLHPRAKPQPAADRGFVTAQVRAPAGDAPKALVLAPTDYSPLK
jgi:hypothetical protein